MDTTQELLTAMRSTFERITYIIPAENRKPLEVKLAEINKKAAKLGVTPMAISFEHDRIEKWQERTDKNDPDSPMREMAREWLRATVIGEPIRVADYMFIGTLYHTDEGNILLSVPGQQIPEHYRDAKSDCDHCRSARRRKDTYVVRHIPTGDTKQVGSSCLQDFFGHDVRRYASWAEILGAFRTSCEGFTSAGGYGMRLEERWSLSEVLAQTVACVRVDGWLSRSKATELNERYAETSTKTYVPTASNVSYLLTARGPFRQSEREWIDARRITTEDRALAEEIRTWAQSLDNPDGSDYIGNLQLIIRADTVTLRVLGLAASIVSVYRRAMNIVAERKTEAKSEFVGTVGERIRDLPVTIVAEISLPGNEFGPRTLVKMKDAAGNLLVWFTGGFTAPNSPVLFPPDERDNLPETVYLTGTVKEHSVYHDIKQTILSRCALALEAKPVKVKKSRKAEEPK